MKRFVAAFLSLLISAFSLLPAITAKAAAVNLISNPGVETSTNGATPDGWVTGKWGSNSTTFTYSNTGSHTGARSLKTVITKYTDGDAKWYFAPVNVAAGNTYKYSEWYHGSVTTDIVAQVDNGTTYQYIDLGERAAGSQWAQFSGTITIPAGMSHLTVFHVVNSVGFVQTDDYSLTQVSNLAVNVTGPTASTSVSGNAVALTASATSASGVAGVQFKVDGENVGSEVTTAPYQTNWDTTTISNGNHTITAVGRDSDGTLVTSTGVQVTVANATTDGTNMVPNPGLETASTQNTKLPVSWTSSAWGTNKPLFTYTSGTDVHAGQKAVKTQLTSYTDGDAKWYFTPQTVDENKLYTFSNWYKSSTESYVVADFAMADGTDQYVTLGTLKSSAWTKFEQQFSVPKGAKTVTVFHMIKSVGWVITDDYNLASYTPIGFNRAVVSLTFDDAWANVYTNALPVLQKYGYHSTQYLLSGNTGDPEYMNQSMMLALKNAGEEIASHTVDHQDLVPLTAAQQKSELNDSKTSLQSWTGATVTDFASPYGSVDQNVMANIKKYYNSHRGVVSGFNSKNYFNIYDIKVQDVTSTTSLEQIQAWVNQAVNTKTWLVLVYHQVSDNPSAGDYNTTPAQLDAHLNVMKTSGITVETVSQALAELKPQL
ncbi:MAG TPA: polysaccharide deacetylase family protein [Candidatus Saccharimonadales bacterium]|nr:polysaccharide deacetylase family protein [Candidatus Saccharimonadales bacterium]